MESEKYEQRKHRGGHVTVHEPTSTHEVYSSPFIIRSFEDAHCITFFQRIEELEYNDQWTSSFATKLKKNKVTIA